MLAVATRPHEVADLEPDQPGFLDAAAVRQLVDSPTYLAGRHAPDDCALVDPARLAWGLAEAAESRGVRIAEHTRLESMRPGRDHVEAVTSGAVVRARRVVLATTVFPSPMRRLRYRTLPVYDYVLATEPLTAEQ